MKNNYKGSESKLNDSQTDELKMELHQTIHLTTTSVIEYVTKKFNVVYTQSSMRDLLHRIGYRGFVE